MVRAAQIYLDALATVPEISVHMGTFLTSEKFAGLVKPPDFRPRLILASPWPDLVKVVKVEEKGSDVNLASHLLLDAFQNNFDVAAVVSNDSDLVEPMRIVTKVLGETGRAFVASHKPHTRPWPCIELYQTDQRERSPGVAVSGPIVLADGSKIVKPLKWS